MKRIFSALMLASIAVAASGCAMCCAPDDGTYSTFGGKWTRHDRVHGRVGSAFSPPDGYAETIDGYAETIDGYAETIDGEVIYDEGEMVIENSPTTVLQR